MTPHKDIDLLVIGEINADLILTGRDVTPIFGQMEKLVEGASLTVGSSSVITACGGARLGLRTAFVGVVGDDPLGEFLLSAMRKRGIDVSGCRIDPGSPTGVSVILNRVGSEQDRAILTAPGTMASLAVSDIESGLLTRARHLHCGSYYLQPRLHPELAGLFEQARSHGTTCSVDTNWDPQGAWNGGLAQVLAQCDHFFPNAQELLRITRTESLRDALAAVASLDLCVAVKLGKHGAGVQLRGRKLFAMAPTAVVTDTVGAGDSFNAGFIYGAVKRLNLESTLALAVACGTLSTRAPGGTAGQPTLDEAKSLAARITVQEMEAAAWPS